MDQQPQTREQVALTVTGMTCSNCALTVQRYLEGAGAEQVSVDFTADEVLFEAVDTRRMPEWVKGIERLGYKVAQSPEEAEASPVQRYFLFSLPFTALLLLHMVLPWHLLHNPWLQLALAAPVFSIGVWHFGRSAWHSLKTGVPNMDVLIILGAGAAFVYSLYGTLTKAGPAFLFYETAATIISLVLLGNLLEQRAVKRTTSAVQSLMRLQPARANVVRNGVIEQIPASSLNAGDVLQVNLGERIPADGIVLQGEAQLDESLLTGESLPVSRKTDDKVVAGGIVLQGQLRIQAQATGRQTSLAHIIEMVRRAQADKPDLQRLADRISAVFVPVVVAIALLTFAVSFLLLDLTPKESIIRAVAVLVISCPCAMGLATPTAVVVGLGRASAKGILIKGANTLEMVNRVKTVIFDKTGTLTTGAFSLIKTELSSGNTEQAASIALALAQRASHPLARSLAAALQGAGSFALNPVAEHKGQGMEGLDESGNRYRLGAPGWALQQEGLFSDPEAAQTVLTLSKNGELLAAFYLGDTLRPGAKELIEALRSKNVRSIMLSGDRRSACEYVGKALGIDEIYAEQTPAQKLEAIRGFAAKEPVAMIGDGINDAPALALAHVGISLSGATDVAMQSAQVVLLKPDLRGLLDLMAIGKHTALTIRQNLFWAFAYNVVAIPLAAAGFLSPMLGAAAMAFSDIVVIGNSLRLKVKRLG